MRPCYARARGYPSSPPGPRTPVGWLQNADVLRAYNDRLEQALERPQTSPARGGDRDQRRVSAVLARLRGYRIVDLELATDDAPVGRRLDELAWPGRSTVLAIRRGDTTFEPDGEELLEHGDRLTVLVPSSATDGLVDAISSNG